MASTSHSMTERFSPALVSQVPVSYTHLDVYKRQGGDSGTGSGAELAIDVALPRPRSRRSSQSLPTVQVGGGHGRHSATPSARTGLASSG